ncbi:sensor histidine kinase [Nocardioides pocheonensis]|uniref:histidine kinase n=1 Tax=Nocardioides pocheonensis TaxID=661485 RepID=A0A3N0GYI9_9ACTN|nr:sensor histidine kinase [Nocardioides pocheonensis]
MRGFRTSGQVDPRVTAQAAVDLRVSMVLAVLGGRSVEDVAQEWDVESSLLHRWVRDFLVAGTAVITNQPDPDEARQRDRFLAAFAHELRTPVAVARGWAMMLAEGDVPEEKLPESHERLADALTRLSDHILDVELSASASLGRVRVNAEPIDLATLCQGLTGSPDVRHGADLSVYADPRLLSRVLRDLWETAHREPTPDRVSIDVVESGSWQEIRVVREGEPISPMILRALFDPFGTNDDTTGVTIGLYLARALVVAHGGFLGAEGDEEGTVLLARLPREPAQEPAPGPTPAGPGPDGDKGGKP